MCPVLPTFKSPTYFPCTCHCFWSLEGWGRSRDVSLRLGGNHIKSWSWSASFSVIYHHQDWGCGRWVGGAGKKKIEGHIVLWKLSKGVKKLELCFLPLTDLDLCSVRNSSLSRLFYKYLQWLTEGTETSVPWWEGPF